MTYEDKYNECFAGLLAKLPQVGKTTKAAYPNPGAWAAGVPIILDGRPFGFAKHEYLKKPYADPHPWQVAEKAAQLGVTTKAILSAIFYSTIRNYRGVLYLFPSRTDTFDFSKSRLTPLIDENPTSIGAVVGNTDAAGIKQIGNTFFYLRGMISRVGLKSIPVDRIIFDELDEAPQRMVDMALERMGHSEFGEVEMLSNPTLPDYGVNAAFQLSDQHYWLLKCPACGHYTCLEDSWPSEQGDWPKCMGRAKDGRVYRACLKCGGELNPDMGEWVPKKAGADRRGYHYSQLWSHFVDPADIVDKWFTTHHLTEFYNLKLGLPYVEAQNRLSLSDVLALCGDYPNQSDSRGPCSMGIDQGRDLHVVIGAADGGERPNGRIIHVGVYKDWEELDRLMRTFGVSRCVVDALPEQRNARAFAERWPGKVFLNFYNDKQKGAYKWDEEQHLSACDRTESLDASHREVTQKLVWLPRQCGEVEEFAAHCHNVARKLEENPDTGSKRYVYVKLGPDHYRHAFNYEAMARQGGLPGPPEYMSVRPARLDRGERGY